jgi:hypothetical protein
MGVSLRAGLLRAPLALGPSDGFAPCTSLTQKANSLCSPEEFLKFGACGPHAVKDALRPKGLRLQPAYPQASALCLCSMGDTPRRLSSLTAIPPLIGAGLVRLQQQQNLPNY